MKPTVLITSLLSLLMASEAVAAEDCAYWPPNPQGVSLQDFMGVHQCVIVNAGVWSFSERLIIPAGHILKGVGMDQTVVQAAEPWADNPTGSARAALVENSPFGHVTVSDLTVDAHSIAVLGISAREMTIERVRVRGALCDGITINGYGMIIRDSRIESNGKNCILEQKDEQGNIKKTNINGAGIYAEGSHDSANNVVPESFAPLIEGNTIVDNFGPGLDVNTVWSGIFRNNTVQDNKNWSAVSLANASRWLIANNVIHHPSVNTTFPWKSNEISLVRLCVGGPNGERSSAITVCMTSDTNNAVSNENRILSNTVSGGYGILLIGNDETLPYLVPRGNIVKGNNVFGSNVGCGDDFDPQNSAQLPFGGANEWSCNNCRGSANTDPDYF